MPSILSTLPEEVIAAALAAFDQPLLQTHTTIDPATKSSVSYQQCLSELSKLHQLQATHSPDDAVLAMRELDIPPNVINLLAENYSKRSALAANQFSYAWRLDQSVPSVQAVLLNIRNKQSGEVKTMRMDLSTFHKLRFNVSLLVKEYEGLNKRVNKKAI